MSSTLKELPLTPREITVMNVLWRRGSATVHEAREDLDEGLAYTSVLSVLQRLETRSFVDHEKEGKKYRYHPTVYRHDILQEALEVLVVGYYQGDLELLREHLAQW